IYLSVLNRYPSAKERADGIKALRSAGADLAAMVAENKKRVEALEAYKMTLDERQKAWEAGMLDQKPTTWTTLEVSKAEAKQGPTPAVTRDGATLTVNKDGSITASGKTDVVDVYTITGKVKFKDPITALRLEVLGDPSLPAKGPGRADNGNFVLNELRLNYRPADKPDDKPKAVKLTAPQATFQQDGYPVANAIAHNPPTRWASARQFGKNNAAMFRFQQPVPAVDEGVELTVVMDQRFGSGHVIGKFRLSVTTDKNAKLMSPLTPEQIAILETPWEERTPQQAAKLRTMYLAQDKEYQKLSAEAADAPPADPRVLGAQDLTWALINSPAFLFNH